MQAQLIYYSNGGINFENVNKMTTNERDWFFRELKKFKEEEQAK